MFHDGLLQIGIIDLLGRILWTCEHGSVAGKVHKFASQNSCSALQTSFRSSVTRKVKKHRACRSRWRGLISPHMKTAGALPTSASFTQPRLWPVSVPAYHALGELGLIPQKTELLYGQVFHKMPKSPQHSSLFMRLLRLLQQAP
jgi:hypothetical protein